MEPMPVVTGGAIAQCPCVLPGQSCGVWIACGTFTVGAASHDGTELLVAIRQAAIVQTLLAPGPPFLT